MNVVWLLIRFDLLTALRDKRAILTFVATMLGMPLLFGVLMLFMQALSVSQEANAKGGNSGRDVLYVLEGQQDTALIATLARAGFAPVPDDRGSQPVDPAVVLKTESVDGQLVIHASLLRTLSGRDLKAELDRAFAEHGRLLREGAVEQAGLAPAVAARITEPVLVQYSNEGRPENDIKNRSVISLAFWYLGLALPMAGATALLNGVLYREKRTNSLSMLHLLVSRWTIVLAKAAQLLPVVIIVSSVAIAFAYAAVSLWGNVMGAAIDQAMNSGNELVRARFSNLAPFTSGIRDLVSRVSITDVVGMWGLILVAAMTICCLRLMAAFTASSESVNGAYEMAIQSTCYLLPLLLTDFPAGTDSMGVWIPLVNTYLAVRDIFAGTLTAGSFVTVALTNAGLCVIALWLSGRWLSDERYEATT